MKIIKKEMRLFLMLMAFWIILAGELSLRQVVSGFLCSILTIGIYHWVLKNSGADRVSWLRLQTILHFSAILLSEIFKSAIRHIQRIVAGHSDTGDCRLNLEIEDEVAIALLSNAITLTPGTVTLEADRKALTVLYYGNFPKQCPLDLVLMVDRLQEPLLKETCKGGCP